MTHLVRDPNFWRAGALGLGLAAAVVDPIIALSGSPESAVAHLIFTAVAAAISLFIAFILERKQT